MIYLYLLSGEKRCYERKIRLTIWKNKHLGIEIHGNNKDIWQKIVSSEKDYIIQNSLEKNHFWKYVRIQRYVTQAIDSLGV